MSDKPRLSIGMPVYNGEALLAETLASFAAQTFSDFELVVVDNASTDQTATIVAEAARRDRRIRYVRNERNIGASGNFCRAAELATAPLFKWAAHDDLYAPTYLERCISVLDADPAVVLAHADSVFIDEAGRPFRKGPAPGTWIEPRSGATYLADPTDLSAQTSSVSRFRDVLFRSLWGTHMFGVIRTQSLRRTGLIQSVPSADRPLLAELSLLGRFHTVPEPLFLKRFHSRMTTALTEREIKSYMSGSGAAYSKRLRQLGIFLAAPNGKQIGWAANAACRGMVFAYGMKVAVRTARGLSHQAINPAAGSCAILSKETGLGS